MVVVVIGMPHLLPTGFWEGRVEVCGKRYVVRFFAGSDFVQRVTIFLATHEWNVKNWTPVVDKTGKQATVESALLEIAA